LSQKENGVHYFFVMDFEDEEEMQSTANGEGHNGAPSYTQEQYEAWKREYGQADKAVLEATGERKDLRARIKGAIGKNGMKGFDQARRLALMPGADRDEIDAHTRRMLEWEKKPFGFQAGFQGFDMSSAPPPAMLNLDDEEIEAIKRQAYDSGKAGKRADRNPWTPGTRPHEIWLASWTEGNGDKVTEEIRPTALQPQARGRTPAAKPATSAKPDGRKGRVVTEAQKEAMRLGRERARAAKAAAAGGGEPAPPSAEPPLLN
jgi:ribosome modulation factor